MSYQDILTHITGEGIAEYDQTQAAINARLDIGNGICRALAINWLIAKKETTNFWTNNRGTIATAFLNNANGIKGAINLQKEYEEGWLSCSSCDKSYLLFTKVKPGKAFDDSLV